MHDLNTRALAKLQQQATAQRTQEHARLSGRTAKALLGDRVALPQGRGEASVHGTDPWGLGRYAADCYAERCWRHEGEPGERADWCAAWFEGWGET